MKVTEAFRASFGREPDGVWAAPGRVNLIGEHTDYNDGFVLPLALSQQTVAAAAISTDGRSRARSLQSPDEIVSFAATDIAPGQVDGWGGYVAGVAWALRDSGAVVGDLDLVVDSDVPLGAGLSSSAALECAVAAAWSGPVRYRPGCHRARQDLPAGRERVRRRTHRSDGPDGRHAWPCEPRSVPRHPVAGGRARTVSAGAGRAGARRH